MLDWGYPKAFLTSEPVWTWTQILFEERKMVVLIDFSHFKLCCQTLISFRRIHWKTELLQWGWQKWVGIFFSTVLFSDFSITSHVHWPLTFMHSLNTSCDQNASKNHVPVFTGLNKTCKVPMLRLRQCFCNIKKSQHEQLTLWFYCGIIK